jgi:hypothetical protein
MGEEELAVELRREEHPARANRTSVVMARVEAPFPVIGQIPRKINEKLSGAYATDRDQGQRF